MLFLNALHDNFDTAGIYLLKVNNRYTRTRCEICSYFTPCSGVSIVNFEHVIAGWEIVSILLSN